MTASIQNTPSRKYTTRIIDMDDVGSDTRIVKIELDNKQKMPFLSGQYALLSTDGFDPQAFSIASTPDKPYVEFHIRNTGRGGITTHLCENIKLGSALSVEAPFGHAFYRKTKKDILAIGGGLGIAPLKALVDEHFLTKNTPASPLYLYWGVRTVEQLYLDLYFKKMADKYPQFIYIPVLSNETLDTYRHGFVGHAVMEDLKDLSSFDVYLSGPPQMIEHTLPTLLDLHADKDHLYGDGISL